MSTVIGVPVTRISCGVLIERVRTWSAIEEVIFLLLTQEALTMGAIAELTDQPHQVILAAIARLMQFRQVELRPMPDGAAFGVSPFGLKSFRDGHPLPTFPVRIPKRFSFVIEAATGDFFPASPLRLMSLAALKKLPQARILRVVGGEPDRSQAANIDRLTRIATRRADERVAGLDGRTATVNDKDYLVVRVADGEIEGLPDTAGEPLRDLLLDTAKRKATSSEVVVPYNGRKPRELAAVRTYDCDFDPDDLIVGGEAHRDLFLRALKEAHGRLIIHSTFLDAKRFAALMDGFHDACARGVHIHLLWGDDPDELVETETKIAASDIMALADADPEMRGRFTVHMDGTQSHAKLLLWDTDHNGWIAVLGSCNWIRSGFQSVELSVVLRHQHVVADICEVLQHMAGRRGLLDALANEMGITVRDLQRERPPGGGTKLSVVLGTGHNDLMREASLAADRRLLIGAHKLGSTARTGAILPSEAAAKRGVESAILYSMPSRPVEKKHARELEVETGANGVRLLKVARPALHGKFVVWDHDDVVITSLNWTSGAAHSDHPTNDLGIHLRAPGLAELLISRLRSLYPKAFPGEAAPADSAPPAQGG